MSTADNDTLGGIYSRPVELASLLSMAFAGLTPEFDAAALAEELRSEQRVCLLPYRDRLHICAVALRAGCGRRPAELTDLPLDVYAEACRAAGIIPACCHYWTPDERAAYNALTFVEEQEMAKTRQAVFESSWAEHQAAHKREANVWAQKMADAEFSPDEEKSFNARIAAVCGASRGRSMLANYIRGQV